MKKIAFEAVALLFSLIATAGEPMATMKYVTNQVNRLDGRIDAVPTYSDMTNIAKTAVQPGDGISVLTNDLNFVDETITNGLITATNAMAYADQVGEDTLEKAKEEMERQGLVNTNDLKLVLAGKRDKSDVKAYVAGSTFDLSKIDSDYPAVAPFVCYPAKVQESPARYVWLLVDKNGNTRKSSEVYNTQTALMSAKAARFSYGASTYTVAATDKPADYSFIYTGDGSGITDFAKTPFGNLATEPFVTAKAEEIIEAKGFATEDFVTENYYDKTTVDNKISGATPFKIATGEYVQNIARIPLFDGSTEGSAIIEGCWLTNVVLNTANGYPQSATIHLNGTYCGRTFDNEEYNLTAVADGNYARFVINDEQGKYTLYYYSYTPSDPLNTKYRGYFTVNRSSPYETKYMYSFTEHRILGSLEEEVDATPMSSHSKSLITSKAVYDATNGKLNKTGGTMTGNLEFSGTTTLGVWTVPSRTVYGGRYLANGNVSSTVNGKKTNYGAGIFAGEGEILNPDDVKYPQALRFLKEEIVGSNADIYYTRYTIDGIEQETAKVYNGKVTKNGASLKIPKDATTGLMFGGTLARVEDIAPVQKSVEDMAGDISKAQGEIASLKTTGLKSPNAISLQNSSGTTVTSYDGSAARTVKFGNGLTATQSSATTTVAVDDTKYPSKTTVASDIASAKTEMKKAIDGKVVDRIYENISRPDAITAVYVISNSSTRKEYPIAFCTTNWSGTATSATFEAIDNPAIYPSSTLRGWSKASMSVTGSGTYTNWNVYVYVSANKPSSYGSCFIQFINDKYPIFPGEIGETRASYSGGYYLRKIAQFNGAVGKYIAGDGNIYSVSGGKIDSLVKTSELDEAIEAKVGPVENTASSAQNGVNSLNKKMENAESDISTLKEMRGKVSNHIFVYSATNKFNTTTLLQEYSGQTAMYLAPGAGIEMKMGKVGTTSYINIDTAEQFPTGLYDDSHKRKMDGRGNIKFKMPKYSFGNGAYPFTRTDYAVKDGELVYWRGTANAGETMVLVYTNHMMYCGYRGTPWRGECPDPLFEGHISLTSGTIYNIGFEDGWYDAGCRFATPTNIENLNANITSVSNRMESEIIRLDGRIDSASTEITKANARIGASFNYTTAVSNKVEQEIADANGRIDNSFAYTTAVSNRMESEIIRLDGRIDSASNEITKANARIGASFNYTTAVSNKVEKKIADANVRIDNSFAYTTAVSNRMESMIPADPLCFTDGNLVSRHLFAKAPYAFYWTVGNGYYSHMKWRKIVFRDESDLTDYYIDFSPVAYGNYKGVLRYYNKYSSSKPNPAMMFQVRIHAGSTPDDEVTFDYSGDSSIRIRYFNSIEELLGYKSFTISTEVKSGGYDSYTIQAMYDAKDPTTFGTAYRAVRYSEIFGTGREKVEITNGSIPFRHEAVNFTYTSGTFGVNTTDWPNYKSTFIFGTVAAGVSFASNIRFSGFVNSDGKVVPASATTIPRGSKWYGNIRRIDSNYYIEYIGVCE